MTPFHLTALSLTITTLTQQALKIPFRIIEKAHEHLRETERRHAGAELVKGKVS